MGYTPKMIGAMRKASLKYGCVIALLAIVGCKKTATGGSGGTIVLSIDSKAAVDHIAIHAYSPDNKETQFDFSVAGKDLTKAPVSGEITPGPTIGSGTVMFVGLGYANNVMVASGRASGMFTSGKRTTATLTLRGGIVDADQDGWTVADGDCNDQSSAQNPFLKEVCGDNVDNNCDGSIDEGCACTGAQTLSCYAGPPGTRGFGVCVDGTQTCLNGKWDTCRNSVGPTAEQCKDGYDNNCDGSIDEGCPCDAGSQRFCYIKSVTLVGEPATAISPPLKGECRAGTQICVGTAWGACTGAVLAKAETCNGLDDDCDGVFDNGFDADGDGFTTCGTKHDSCTLGVASVVIGGGVAPQFIDCDDAKANVHPCQNNRCDDGGLDTNCSGQVDICADAASCQALGYFDAFSGATDGAGAPRCLFNGKSFTPICGGADSSVCNDPSVVCTAAPTAGADTGFSRRACHEPAGCTGSTAPTDTVAITSGDPHNDCGGVACDGSTGGQAYYSSWVTNPTALDCYFRANVAAGATNCKADATCDTAADKCPSSAQGAVAQAITTACTVPTGCTGTTAPGSAVGNNVDDPLGTCTTSVCINVALSAWVDGGGTSTCTVVSGQPGSGKYACVSGACATSPAGGGCVLATSVPKTCHTECKIQTSCNLDAASPGPYCYNDNGGTRAIHVAGTCSGTAAAGRDCFAATAGQDSSAQCGDCTQAFACGTDCAACTAAKYCTGNTQVAATACADCTVSAHCGSDCGLCATGTYCHGKAFPANSGVNQECQVCTADNACGPTASLNCTGGMHCKEIAGGATCSDCACSCQ